MLHKQPTRVYATHEAVFGTLLCNCKRELSLRCSNSYYYCKKKKVQLLHKPNLLSHM